MRVYVPLDKEERRALVQLADLERRDFRQQAALFVRRGLEQAGMLQQVTAPEGKAANARQ